MKNPRIGDRTTATRILHQSKRSGDGWGLQHAACCCQEHPAPGKAWQVTTPAAVASPLLIKEHLQEGGAQRPAAGRGVRVFWQTSSHLILEHLLEGLVNVRLLGRAKEAVPALGLVAGTGRVVPHVTPRLYSGVQPESGYQLHGVVRGLALLLLFAVLWQYQCSCCSCACCWCTRRSALKVGTTCCHLRPSSRRHVPRRELQSVQALPARRLVG